MRTYEIITTLQILAGTVIILSSIVSSMKTLESIPGSITNRRLIAISFAVLFLTGFIFSFFSLLTDVRFPFELLSGTLFLGSACFVYISFKITANTRGHLAHKIAQYNSAEDKLKGLFLRDELTGLYNRHGFITLMDSQLKLARRQKKRIVLFYADVDDLKGVNDNLGEQEGDIMLREVANILKAGFRGSDIIARIGEDEFIVVLIEASEDHFETINGNFRNILDEHNSKRHEKYKLSISTGLTSYDPEYNDSIDNLLAHVYELVGGNKEQSEKSHLPI